MLSNHQGFYTHINKRNLTELGVRFHHLQFKLLMRSHQT